MTFTPVSAGPAVASGVADLIGRTPLVRLRTFGRTSPRVELYAKAEWQNPGGSVKDRTALAIITDAERRGALAGGRRILDATSGNTGIAYAMIAAVRGYKLTLCVPGNVTPERKRILVAFGAELVFTPALEGSDGAIRTAQRLYAERPDEFFYADQYNSDANWRAHFDTTGPEILAQTAGRLTHLVAGLGTSGTFMGVGRRLRQDAPGVRLISVEPDSPLHGIEGLKHMATALRPGIYDDKVADERIEVTTERAIELTRRLALDEGLLIGVSSGAALAAGLDVAAGLTSGVVVMIFPDSGSRYLSEQFWDEAVTG